jgi:flavorubredoxin
MFPDVREGVSKVLDPATIRWISFSHFEADECGALNEWFAVAPRAQAACGMVGGLVSVNDFTGRETRILTPKEPLSTGKYRFRYYQTPHLPHGWDAGVMFEETGRTLFCSDLFHHDGEVEPLTHSSILDRVRQTLTAYQAGLFGELRSVHSQHRPYSRDWQRSNPKRWPSRMARAIRATAGSHSSI